MSLWRRRMDDNRGIALMIVLTITTILTVLILDLHDSVRINFYISTNLSAGIKASYLTRSAVQVAAGTLLKDIQDNNVDHLSEGWYDFLAKAGLPGIVIDKDQIVLMEIFDESGRFNLNRLVNRQGKVDQSQLDIFNNLLTELEITTEINLGNAIVDWIDADEETADGGGSEDGVYGYESMTGMLSKNSRFESLQEVRMVAGMTDEIWQKLEPLVTIYGDAKMNLNTVDSKVMRAVMRTVDENADLSLADKIDEWRRSTSSDGEEGGDMLSAFINTEEANYFEIKNMTKILTGELGMDERMARHFKRYFGVSSHFFRVTCTALVSGVQKNGLGIIARYKKKARVIYFRMAPGVSSEQAQAMANVVQQVTSEQETTSLF